MKIAVVNNANSYPQNILRLIGQEAEVFNFDKADEIDVNDFDLLILSGSSQFPIEYNKEKLQGEINLIRRSTIPTLGICYGCELIAVSFGGKLKDRGEGTQELKPIKVEVIERDEVFRGRKDFVVYDAHRWVIDTLPDEFEVLARSLHGPEVIRHKERPLYGFQFHPEKMLDETFGDELFNEFIRLKVENN